ncbi:DUF6308 family protein [Actinomycetota bacterium]
MSVLAHSLDAGDRPAEVQGTGDASRPDSDGRFTVEAVRTIDVTAAFPGGMPAVAFDEALKRLVAFCASHRSGWVTYDLFAAEARQRGHFEEVAPWSLLWADALAGRLSVNDLASFTTKRRLDFAHRVAAVPRAKDLAAFEDLEVEAVVDLCKFGFAGVWAPKITKLAALYRPRAVPVLDGYVAMAFGFKRAGFSEGKEPRHGRIRSVVFGLRDYLAQHDELMGELRASARLTVPDIDVASDLRLLDIVLWCSQDDRIERPGKRRNAWLDASPAPYSSSFVAPIPVPAAPFTGGECASVGITLEEVRGFVRAAHGTQQDKLGRDYYDGHLGPIAAKLAEHGVEAEMAGLLHDILEDTVVTADQLLRMGVPQEVVRAVESVSKRAGESYDALIERAAADPLGRLVKLADNAHNLESNDELANSDPELAGRLKIKYETARARLIRAEEER